jgi:hypothetical protein
MNLPTFFFYLGLFFQLVGLASVGLCFLAGVQQGDYGRIELAQFIGGSLIFYLGNFVKKRSST